jgi:hypothetical protein
MLLFALPITYRLDERFELRVSCKMFHANNWKTQVVEPKLSKTDAQCFEKGYLERSSWKDECFHKDESEALRYLSYVAGSISD